MKKPVTATAKSAAASSVTVGKRPCRQQATVTTAATAEAAADEYVDDDGRLWCGGVMRQRAVRGLEANLATAIEEHETLTLRLARATQERDKFERKYELIRNDPDYQQCCDLRQLAEEQLAAVTAHLEAQRTATYQAVEREHEAKQQLATALQERDAVIQVHEEIKSRAEAQLAEVTQP